MTKRLMLSALVSLGLLALVVPGVPAQEQEQEGAGFQNLQVLPKDIAKQDLKAVMESFTAQLGVRCTFCHVPDEYGKDDVAHKADARRMMKLVQHMKANKDQYYDADLAPARINCGMCHRGKAEPELYAPE